LTFPVGHSADVGAIAAATGAFVHDDPLFVQSTGFVPDPAGRVVVRVYPSGVIGRLVPIADPTRTVRAWDWRSCAALSRRTKGR
jgi:hypothetical protein